MVIPALYAYTIPALDTRYLYILFPMFSVLAVLSIERIIGKFSKSNIIIIVIISAIFVSSILFYDYKKIDFEHEKESFEIMKNIFQKIGKVNVLSTESRYLTTVKTLNQWPSLYSELHLDTQIKLDENEDNIYGLIMNSKEKGLTHIMTDSNEKRPNLLKELFFNETKYSFLKKIYDSRNNGFEYHIKVFEINYKLFDSLNEKMDLSN